MKYSIFLLIVLIFTSMCAGMPIDMSLPTGQNNIILSDPYFDIDIEAIPREATSNRDMTLVFQATNNNNYDLEGIVVEAYDSCIFGDNGQKKETIDLRSNQSKTWTWTWYTGETRLEKECEIKFSVKYGGTFSLYQDVAVLSFDEYLSRQSTGDLNSIPVNSRSTNSPLRIYLNFPEKQPFIEDTRGYSMEIDFRNVGDGFLTVQKGNIDIDESGNIGSVDCDGYFSPSSDNLRFIKNEAPTATCYFDTEDINQPISIDTMTITAQYTYMIDKSVFVTVKPNKLSEPQDRTLCSEIFSSSVGQCVEASSCHATCNYGADDCQADGMCCCSNVG